MISANQSPHHPWLVLTPSFDFNGFFIVVKIQAEASVEVKAARATRSTLVTGRESSRGTT